jgi:sec-independent protein translocase protein TatA
MHGASIMTVIPTPFLGGILPGGPEWLIILAVLILLFGAKKLPELAKGLGRSVNEFKKASKEVEAEDAKEPSEAELKAQLAAAKAELAAAKAKNSGNN